MKSDKYGFVIKFATTQVEKFYHKTSHFIENYKIIKAGNKYL